MAECRVYANQAHLNPKSFPYVNDICRAIWGQEQKKINLNRQGIGIWQFIPAELPQDANIYLLPLRWNYYLDNSAVYLAWQEVEHARALNKRIVVFSDGDYTANLPFDNAILFERSTYASRRFVHGNLVYAMPAFIPDYLQIYCQGQMQIRSKGKTPVVGFCGQAGGNWFDITRRTLATRFRKVFYSLKLRNWEPAPYETTQERQKILDYLKHNSSIQSNFLIRHRYRAGYQPKVKDPFHLTRMEFIRNILDSDYTVCVRGAGNFSVRFYETLCLGRIPIFVNTDCVLPYEQEIDYRQYCVWVEKDEIPWIGQKVLDFHQAISPNRFKELQAACHQLWQERLSITGFYSHFGEHMHLANL